MSVDKAVKRSKRQLSKEKETSSKKRRNDAQVYTAKVNGLNKEETKKAPRLSPALFCDKCEIQHRNLHQLLKYAVFGKEGSDTQASWCRLHHQKRLRSVVIVVLEDLSQHHFFQYYLHFHGLRRLFTHRFSLPPPPGDFIASLVGWNKETIDSNHLHNGITDPAGQHCNPSNPAGPNLTYDPILWKYGTKRHGLTRYLLSQEEMRKNNYPFVGSPDTGNFVQLNCAGDPTDSSPLYGLDCEMCLTDKGDELTRVSLVDANGNTIMDELVKPDNPIRNYKTRFSGITRSMLLPVKTKLKDVQCKLRSLLPPDAVLVGHSLQNDLHALQIIHPHVIDTVLLFARPFGKKYRLKFLAQAVLKRDIQCDHVIGHNPSEDADAALKLAQYFIEYGPEKVVQLNLEEFIMDANNVQSPLAVQTKVPESKQNGLTHPLQAEHPGLAESLEKLGKKIVYIGKKESIKNPIPPGAYKNIVCASDEEILERGSCAVSQSPVTVIKFQAGSIFRDCSWDSNEKVRQQFQETMTVLVRPYTSNMCLKSLKMLFESCGPIRSLGVLSDTSQPYVCIKYSVLEGAQLAVELLNGTYIDGNHITVQRLMTSKTLDNEDFLKEVAEDPENKATIYVAGFVKPLTEEFLQQKFSHFKDIKEIFVPTNPQTRRLSKYCYIKFLSPDSAAAAAKSIQTHGGLRSVRAVTSSHLHHWLHRAEAHAPFLKQSEQGDFSEIIRDMDRKMSDLYERLQENTLCVVLFPGDNSPYGSLPGFGLMEIKTDHMK